MKTILIPLISKKENNPEFLNKALEGVDEVFLLLTIDAASIPKQYGFTGMEISDGTKLMDEVKKMIEKKHKKCYAIIQWGDTFTTIDHIARLRFCKKIIFFKQDNFYYQDLVKKLKKEKVYSIEEIEIAPPIEEEKE